MRNTTLLEIRVQAEKIHRALELNQSSWLKLYVEFNTQKIIDAEINADKDGKVLHKLMSNAVTVKQ